ncbi:MAG: hypothetical protein RL885_28960 [Planctomycetota bacterium]
MNGTMSRLLATTITLSLAAFLVLGCDTTRPRPTVHNDPGRRDDDVAQLVSGDRLARDLVALDVREVKVDDVVTWEVDVHNLAPYSRDIFYRPVWIDARGQAFGDLEEWLDRSFSAHEVTTLHFDAPPLAEEFTLEIGQRREVKAPRR